MFPKNVHALVISLQLLCVFVTHDDSWQLETGYLLAGGTPFIGVTRLLTVVESKSIEQGNLEGLKSWMTYKKYNAVIFIFCSWWHSLDVRHVIIPPLRGAGTRDEPLRKSAWEAIDDIAKNTLEARLSSSIKGPSPFTVKFIVWSVYF